MGFASNEIYTGGPHVDGAWRQVQSGNLLVFQRRISTVWTNVNAFTEYGGYALPFVANGDLVLGEVVCFAQGGTDEQVTLVPTTGNENDMPIGVVYADAGTGTAVWIVTTGKALVLPESGVTATMGWTIETSQSEAGRAFQVAIPGSVARHFDELGHWSRNGTGAGVATLAALHNN
jgi:hypothetical protein